MSAILMPEVVIYNTLSSIIKLIKHDLEYTVADETKSILYKLLGVDESGAEVKLHTYNFFKQAKKIFTKPQGISINLGYNLEVAKIISLHIILPSESAVPAAIGEDEGYLDEGLNAKYTQLFNSTYQIMITSDNSSEVTVVYHILKSLLIMTVDHLEMMGLRLPTFSGNDIVMQDDLIPMNIFHKVLNLSFTYELTVPQLLAKDFVRRFFTQLRMIDNNEEIHEQNNY